LKLFWFVAATCTKGCINGHCVSPDQCYCDSGWHGDDCGSSKYSIDDNVY